MRHPPECYALAERWGRWPHEVSELPAGEVRGMLAYCAWDARRQSEAMKQAQREAESKSKHNAAKARMEARLKGRKHGL